MEGERSPPVEIGDKLELEVVSEGKKPNTVITKKEGYVIFVQECNAQEHKKVYVEITATLPRYGFAKVVADSEDFGEEKDSEDFGEQEEQEEQSE